MLISIAKVAVGSAIAVTAKSRHLRRCRNTRERVRSEESIGGGWSCNRGYREVNNQQCVEITIPRMHTLWTRVMAWLVVRSRLSAKWTQRAWRLRAANGYLLRRRDDWKCDRGFRQQGNTCLLVHAKNAYLDGSGSDWKCDRGFRKEGVVCSSLTVPVNAYINYSGNDWTALQVSASKRRGASVTDRAPRTCGTGESFGTAQLSATAQAPRD